MIIVNGQSLSLMSEQFYVTVTATAVVLTDWLVICHYSTDSTVGNDATVIKELIVYFNDDNNDNYDTDITLISDGWMSTVTW